MFRLIKKITKKNRTEQQKECTNVSIEDSNPVVYQEPIIEDTDYMRFFFKQEQINGNLKPIIERNLEIRELKELQEVAIEVINMSFQFFRSCSEFQLTKESANLKLSNAVNWFLSDSIHNIPKNLNDRYLLISYLSEFFAFIHTFMDINNLPVNGYGNFVYHELSYFAKDWQHLYKN